MNPKAWQLNHQHRYLTRKKNIRKITEGTRFDSLYLLQIYSPEVSEYNGIYPQDPFIQSPKLTQLMAAQLNYPVTFQWSKGRIGNLMAPEGLSEDSLNVIRGILNLFVLTLKKNQNVYNLQEVISYILLHTHTV